MLPLYNKEMHALCHRCHAELPGSANPVSRGGEEEALFCPHCGAPQLSLPEHLRIESPAVPGTVTTGTLPPPRPAGFAPHQIDWHSALRSAALVAAVSAALGVASLHFTFLSPAYIVWTIGGAILALGFYARQRPQARMDAGVGLRIGSVTGLLIIAFLGVAFTVTGLVTRFGTHRMAGFDGQLTQQMASLEQQLQLSVAQQHRPPEDEQKLNEFVDFLNTPEARTGIILAGVGLQASFILLVATGGGGFAGMLRRPGSLRRNLRERE